MRIMAGRRMAEGRMSTHRFRRLMIQTDLMNVLEILEKTVETTSVEGKGAR